MSAGSYGNVIRLLMPLVISESQLQEGLDVIESGLTS
jgi:4-aminobutyrate aminotransferase/(S)-3-amino-2-methylpropionate transaminase